MKLGIVTVLYKSNEVLPDFYESLSIQDFKNFVLIIIDNDANEITDSILKNLSDQYPNLNTIYINSNGNIGVAAGNNLGIIKAKELNCSHVLLSNNDVCFDDTEMLSGLLNTMTAESVKLITPKILFYDSRKIWVAGGYFNKIRSLGIHFGDNKEADDPEYNISKYITYAPTCFMIITSDVFDQIGIMDEKYFVYVDDTDFIYRCNIHNIKIWYDHTRTILHKVSSSTGGDESPFYVYYANRNKIYFVKKHYNLFYKFIATWHIGITRIVNLIRFNQSNRKALIKGIIDGLNM